MSSHNDAGLGQSFIQWHPAAIKQLDHLITAHSGYTCCWGMSQHALDLASANHAGTEGRSTGDVWTSIQELGIIR